MSTPEPAGPTGPVVCSAKGCREAAAWVLAWNNPRLHTPERRKTWAACDVHRSTLGEHLAVRGFLRETLTLDEWRAGQDG